MKISPAVRRRIFETAANSIANYVENFGCTAITRAIPRVLKLKWNSTRCLNVREALITEYAKLFKPDLVLIGNPWWPNSRWHVGDRKERVLSLLFMAEIT